MQNRNFKYIPKIDAIGDDILSTTRCSAGNDNRDGSGGRVVRRQLGLALRVLRGRRDLPRVGAAVARAGRLRPSLQPLDLQGGDEIHREQCWLTRY